MSPFINLFVYENNLYKMLQNLKSYMDTPIVQLTKEENINYPVGILDNEHGRVEVHFSHYRTFDEAQKAWNKRVERINYNNIIATAILWNRQGVEDFLKLDLDYKIIGFAYTPLDKEYDNILDCNEYFDPEVKKASSNFYWMFMHDSTHRNSKRLFPRFFDPYKLLLKEEHWKLK